MLTRFIITSLQQRIHSKAQMPIIFGNEREENGKAKTNPKVESDLLILDASFKRSPSAPDVFCLFTNFYILIQCESSKVKSNNWHIQIFLIFTS